MLLQQNKDTMFEHTLLAECYIELILLPDFDIVWQQPAVDGLSGVGHEGPAFKAGLLEEPGQSSTVI